MCAFFDKIAANYPIIRRGVCVFVFGAVLFSSVLSLLCLILSVHSTDVPWPSVKILPYTPKTVTLSTMKRMGRAAGGASVGLSDSEKILLQILLDVAAFGVELESNSDLVMSDCESYIKLVTEVSPAARFLTDPVRSELSNHFLRLLDTCRKDRDDDDDF